MVGGDAMQTLTAVQGSVVQAAVNPDRMGVLLVEDNAMQTVIAAQGSAVLDTVNLDRVGV